MASEHTITHFSLLPQHSYNSPNLPGLLPKSSQGSLGPTVLLSLLFPVKYGLIIKGFPFKGNNSWTHLHCYNVFWARKLCRIDDLLPIKFRSHTVSPIQNSLTKNLETVCRLILTETSQKITVNLLMMVLIDLPIIKLTCQHHVSGYVCRVWHLGFFFSYWLK